MNKQFKNRMRFTKTGFVRVGNTMICKICLDLQLDQSSLHGMIDKSIMNKSCTNFGKFSITGKAKLHPGDKFDEVVGKRIAESRAKRKAYARASRLISALVESAERQIQFARLYAAQLRGCAKKEDAHINKLV